MDKMPQIVITASNELKRAAKAKAALQGKSLSSIVNAWLFAWLAEDVSLPRQALYKEWLENPPQGEQEQES